MKLTKRATDAIVPGDQLVYFFDTDLPGFFLRVRPTGAKTWGLQYRAGSGRGAVKKRIIIAAFGKVTPDEARAAAKRLLADVTHGDDPAAQKAAKAKEMTVAGLIDLYEEEGCFVQWGVRQGEPMKERTKATRSLGFVTTWFRCWAKSVSPRSVLAISSDSCAT
ncbi:Arm DNA-binding domain-containing protein [Xanthobacter sp. KR7-65]|uniref:Arm DNA-binding domain-containing protein n=1 Tax=Xanthobacter sp. KR7-65 TaxID=3156612 RepID=UPI0032B47A07